MFYRPIHLENAYLIPYLDKVEIKDIDIRNYAKFILKEGTNVEKRELLGCLKSKIELKDKKILISN